jgi:FAD/FMN-containing dehydrogenase
LEEVLHAKDPPDRAFVRVDYRWADNPRMGDRCLRCQFLGWLNALSTRKLTSPPRSLKAGILGHAGDGNFHVGFYLLPNDQREIAEAQRLNERLVHRALALDGTCTGEHGVGCGKIDFMLAEHSEAISIMRAIKSAIDPHNIMNRGKIFRD